MLFILFWIKKSFHSQSNNGRASLWQDKSRSNTIVYSKGIDYSNISSTAKQYKNGYIKSGLLKSSETRLFV